MFADDWVDMSGPSSPPHDSHMPSKQLPSSDSTAEDRLQPDPSSNDDTAPANTAQASCVSERVPTPEGGASPDSGSDSSIVIVRGVDAKTNDAEVSSNAKDAEQPDQNEKKPAEGEAACWKRKRLY